MFKSAKFILFLTIFIDLLGFGIVIPILPNYVKELPGSDVWTGVPVTLYALAQFFFTPIWGALSDKYGRRPIILVSVAISAVSYVIFSFASIFPIVLLARLLGGMGAGNISAAQAYISDITEPKDRAKTMGMIGAAFGLGFIFGPPIGGFLMEDFGFPSIGLFCAGLCVLNFILAFMLLPESIKERRLNVKINILPVADYRRVFGMKLMPYLMVIGFIYTAGFFLFQLPSSLMWKEHFRFSDKEISFIFGFIGISTAIVQGGLIGVFSKWIGEKRLMLYGNILLAISVVLLPFVGKSWFVPLELILLFLLAVANGFVGPSVMSMVSVLAPRTEQGISMGIYQSFCSLARAIGPLLGGALYGINYHVPYLMAFVVYGGNALLVILFLRRMMAHQASLKDGEENADQQQAG